MGTIDTIRTAPSEGHGSRPATGPALVREAALSLFAWIESLAARRRGRLALLEMTDAQLEDIGLSRADAYFEGKRQLWD